MSRKTTDRRRWLIAGVAVPLFAAVIPIAFGGSEPPRVEIALAQGESLDAESKRALEEATRLLKANDLEKAIAKLNALADSPAKLNNLAAAYQKKGETDRARAYLERAAATDDQARSNLARLAKRFGETTTPGIHVALTRFAGETRYVVPPAGRATTGAPKG